MEKIKSNLGIIIAFMLPVLFILIVALTIYIPSFLVKTSYNFVYASCNNSNAYYYDGSCSAFLRKRISVVDNNLVINPVVESTTSAPVYGGVNQRQENYSARYFLHDTVKNESKEISLDEAKSLKYDSLLTSPDGVTISGNYTSGEYFFPFGGSSSNYGQYLVKGSSKKKLNLINQIDRYYYQDNFYFVGWIIK